MLLISNNLSLMYSSVCFSELQPDSVLSGILSIYGKYDNAVLFFEEAFLQGQQTRVDTNQAVQPQVLARGINFWILAASGQNMFSKVSDQVRHRPGCTATEDGQNIIILD